MSALHGVQEEVGPSDSPADKVKEGCVFTPYPVLTSGSKMSPHIAYG